MSSRCRIILVEAPPKLASRRHPHRESAIGRWSRTDPSYFLEIGIHSDGDRVGSTMGEAVDETTSRLTDDNQAAIVEYMLRFPVGENENCAVAKEEC